MTIRTAEEIIAEYGKVLATLKPPHLFQEKQKLPCSVGRIKFAIYRYILELARLRKLNKENAEMLIVAYGHLGFFVSSASAQRLNEIASRKSQNTLEYKEMAEKFKDEIHRMSVQKDQLIEEIQEYIAEVIHLSEQKMEY